MNPQAAKSDKPLVVVFGSTGKQGGAVAKTLLKDGNFQVRAVTRQAVKPAAQELAEMGAELFEADFCYPDVLPGVFEGADYCFCMTDFYQKSQAMKEHEIGLHFVEAAQKAGIKHFVWSSLPNVKEISQGRFDVPHFTDKALVDEALKKSGMNYTIVMPSYFFQNLESGSLKAKGDEIELTLPLHEDADLTALDINDIGPAVLTILKDPKQHQNKSYPLVGEHKALREYIADIERITHRQVNHIRPSLDEYAKSGAPFAEELASMFAYFEEFGYFSHKKPSAHRVNIWAGKNALNHRMHHFDEWFRSSKVAKELMADRSKGRQEEHRFMASDVDVTKSDSSSKVQLGGFERVAEESSAKR